MKKIITFSLFSFLAVIIFIGCKGHVTVDEAYHTLRPVKQLELPDQVDDNLVVIIKNVADEGSSYKNYVELFINDHPINPDWLVSNVQNEWVYKFRLRPGYYDLRGNYFAYIGWGEDKYKIVSEEFIRVQHDKRTVVTAEIVKKPNGEPVNKTMYFETTYEGLSDRSVAEPTSSNIPTPVSNTITLQINTVPEHAQIIIDDKVVGQSPLKYQVAKDRDHIIQVSADGYDTKTKFVDHTKFGNREVFYIIQELPKLY